MQTRLDDFKRFLDAMSKVFVWNELPSWST